MPGLTAAQVKRSQQETTPTASQYPTLQVQQVLGQ